MNQNTKRYKMLVLLAAGVVLGFVFDGALEHYPPEAQAQQMRPSLASLQADIVALQGRVASLESAIDDIVDGHTAVGYASLAGQSQFAEQARNADQTQFANEAGFAHYALFADHAAFADFAGGFAGPQ